MTNSDDEFEDAQSIHRSEVIEESEGNDKSLPRKNQKKKNRKKKRQEKVMNSSLANASSEYGDDKRELETLLEGSGKTDDDENAESGGEVKKDAETVATTNVENPIVNETDTLEVIEPEPVQDPVKDFQDNSVGIDAGANPEDQVEGKVDQGPAEEVEGPKNGSSGFDGSGSKTTDKQSSVDGDLQENDVANRDGLGKPELPSRKSIRECLRIDQPAAQLISSSSEAELNKVDEVSHSYRKQSRNFLLESKFNQLNKNYEAKDSKIKELINSGRENVKKTFNDIKETVGGLSGMLGYEIDWEFWTRVVNNYEDVIDSESDKLNEYISKGIPKEIRGIVWQSISRSKNFQLEEFYYHLKSETSMHEKSIKRDLTRTSFYSNIQQANKGEELFNVIKAYSLFDPDVGYTQGMIFITIPLIMNMNESECFCLLVTLMKEYNLRDLFCPEMKGLHLLLYEFDRLLEINLPRLYNHLVKQGIKSSMYASQWFLTFFAYKFPLDMVLRIYDIIVTQGVESILKFAINLMVKNEESLLALKFDKLLHFLKDNLFNYYIRDDFINFKSNTSGADLSGKASVSRRFSLLGNKRNSGPTSSSSKNDNYYRLDDLVHDSMQINVEPLDLAKFETEFENIYVNEKSRVQEIDGLKTENGKLRHVIKELETDFSSLNRDHIDVVQKMVNIKVLLPEIINENTDIQKSIAQLKTDIEELESKVRLQSVETSSAESNAPSPSSALPTNVESDIQELLAINAKETEKFANLEEELYQLQIEDGKLDSELHSAKLSRTWFSKWK